MRFLGSVSGKTVRQLFIANNCWRFSGSRVFNLSSLLLQTFNAISWTGIISGNELSSRSAKSIEVPPLSRQSCILNIATFRSSPPPWGALFSHVDQIAWYCYLLGWVCVDWEKLPAWKECVVSKLFICGVTYNKLVLVT